MDGITRIESVIYYDVWLDATLFPFPKMKVKVNERSSDFLAVTNLHRRNGIARVTEYTSGIGESAEAALRDLLERFVADGRKHRPTAGYTEEDFEWSDYEDF
ncbi:hypothetical protein [Rubinisphaera brasiliensis]|uniref:Uncharacterized protein n=1 Tax=Rubinisphaera brasiliensis (strain ATCC 49424 / DSM 5305 / JCM 21570 / IAM 15109 / NBRC 103401 / IFAM 1448) TaxID=756272 RepID=F0ST92_RUBBR|nr:hypothetical protein [Rubinisphaera brasiliensis]ADY59303.1 hypothetical protein Plabr_1692 [Rubinisphaera brasiliensis DSM 5305]